MKPFCIALLFGVAALVGAGLQSKSQKQTVPAGLKVVRIARFESQAILPTHDKRRFFRLGAFAIEAINPIDGKVSWRQKYGIARSKARVENQAILRQGNSLFVADEGVLQCLDPETGKVNWLHHTLTDVEEICVGARGKVLFLRGKSGALEGLDLRTHARTFLLRSHGEKYWWDATDLVAPHMMPSEDGVLTLTEKPSIRLIRADGTIKVLFDQLPITGDPSAKVTDWLVAGNRAFIETWKSECLAVDLDRATVTWRVKLDHMAYGPIQIDAKSIFLVLENVGVTCLDQKTGTQNWSFKVKGDSARLSRAHLEEDGLWLGVDGTYRCFDPVSGAEVDEFVVGQDLYGDFYRVGQDMILFSSGSIVRFSYGRLDSGRASEKLATLVSALGVPPSVSAWRTVGKAGTKYLFSQAKSDFGQLNHGIDPADPTQRKAGYRLKLQAELAQHGDLPAIRQLWKTFGNDCPAALVIAQIRHRLEPADFATECARESLTVGRLSKTQVKVFRTAWADVDEPRAYPAYVELYQNEATPGDLRVFLARKLPVLKTWPKILLARKQADSANFNIPAFTCPIQQILDVQTVSGTKWGLFHGGSLGSPLDLWIAPKQGSKWGKPIFVGRLGLWRPRDPTRGLRNPAIDVPATLKSLGDWGSQFVGNLALTIHSTKTSLSDLEIVTLGGKVAGFNESHHQDWCTRTPETVIEKVLNAAISHLDFASGGHNTLKINFPVGQEPFHLSGVRSLVLPPSSPGGDLTLTFSSPRSKPMEWVVDGKVVQVSYEGGVGSRPFYGETLTLVRIGDDWFVTGSGQQWIS